MLATPSNDPDATARPRNRRLISVEDSAATGLSIRGTARLPDPTSPLRERSPIPSGRLNVGREDGGRSASSSSRRRSPAGFGSGLLNGSSWTPNWASMQEFASGLLSGPQSTQEGNAGSRNGSRTRDVAGSRSRSRPTITDVGAGILAEREAALQAVRTASILESWDGVNGGLDVKGNYKRRTSDDVSRPAAGAENVEDTLVYIHHVKPADTYAGIVLRYGCREDALKKANGLWSRDSVQTRKWLALPVDACEIKGRACDGPSISSNPVDLLAPTPSVDDERERDSLESPKSQYDDFFNSRPKPTSEREPAQTEDTNQEWTHVRWVTLHSFPEPVEIGRISRKSRGYFPPRRKKSLHTVSTLSTPRHSLDMLSMPPSVVSPDGPGGSKTSSRRQSILGNRPNIPDATSAPGASTPRSARSRGGSIGADPRPLWMRRPGGVGSLGKSVYTPGPDKDLLNVWAQKHFPSLNLESLPSMSVLGSEMAQFGFANETGNIVDGPFDESRDLAADHRNGTGLDRAAAAVETWLRVAFAKRPGTPTLGSRQEEIGDLIELLDTHSDDGRALPQGGSERASGEAIESGLLSQNPLPAGTSGRSEGERSVRGRMSRMNSSMSSGKEKDD